jgi:arginine decarboxylase
MKDRYIDLIEQSFYFPQEGFAIEDDNLVFNGVPLKYLIEKYGAPLKLTYLPKIGEQIERARSYFSGAFTDLNYKGKHRYCYVTKSCHFHFVLNEVLKYNVDLETSSEYDLDLIEALYKERKSITIINTGFKTDGYTRRISNLINNGFKNVIPVLDNIEEIEKYEQYIQADTCKIGIRVATEEEPNFSFYTSRLGIRNSKVLHFYETRLAKSTKFKLEMLHFFVDTGIKDSMYYWGELKKGVKLYCSLKKLCPSLSSINIGGGLPIRNSLGFEFDYEYMIREIVDLIKRECEQEGVEVPDIFTEFGKYTVGESGAMIYSVLAKKQQNDAELWYMIDNSIMNSLPDTWGINEKFILLPVNKWKNRYTRVNIGGLTCDNSDYYNSEDHQAQVYLPMIDNQDTEPLYIGFFHTGAYQDAVSGYGGIKHCLIPSPKHVLVYRNADGELVDTMYKESQASKAMLRILGYDVDGETDLNLMED